MPRGEKTSTGMYAERVGLGGGGVKQWSLTISKYQMVFSREKESGVLCGPDMRALANRSKLP